MWIAPVADVDSGDDMIPAMEGNVTRTSHHLNWM
jgi:hypothetical protein